VRLRRSCAGVRLASVADLHRGVEANVTRWAGSGRCRIVLGTADAGHVERRRGGGRAPKVSSPADRHDRLDLSSRRASWPRPRRHGLFERDFVREVPEWWPPRRDAGLATATRFEGHEAHRRGPRPTRRGSRRTRARPGPGVKHDGTDDGRSNPGSTPPVKMPIALRSFWHTPRQPGTSRRSMPGREPLGGAARSSKTPTGCGPSHGRRHQAADAPPSPGNLLPFQKPKTKNQTGGGKTEEEERERLPGDGGASAAWCRPTVRWSANLVGVLELERAAERGFAPRRLSAEVPGCRGCANMSAMRVGILTGGVTARG